MAGFAGLAGPALGLFTALVSGGPRCVYRQRWTDGLAHSAWVGPPNAGPDTEGAPIQPVGSHSAYYDATQGIPLDSASPDYGTGWQGGYAPALNAPAGIRVLISQPKDVRAIFNRYGIQLEEGGILGRALASDVAPARGDLVIHPNGTRYEVMEQITPVSVQGTVLGYAFELARLDPTHPIYSI